VNFPFLSLIERICGRPLHRIRLGAKDQRSSVSTATERSIQSLNSIKTKQVNENPAGDVRWSAVSWWTWRHRRGGRTNQNFPLIYRANRTGFSSRASNYKFREPGQNFGPCRGITILFIGQSDGIWWQLSTLKLNESGCVLIRGRHVNKLLWFLF
jgi:hypothetical protein